jgi:hypothetical protein
MDATEIPVLLWQSESETLDFKRDQYPFDGATDEQRSELLKDILAFANAWRTSPARILIGVDEVKHGRSIPVGTQHLLNRTLQTFVQSKVNRPIVFSYEAVEIDGASIGVIEIPVLERPFFLTKAYGKLEANTVYIRRGDTTSTANPDEIALMGAKREESRSQPILEFSFGDLDKRSKLNGEIRICTVAIEVPDDEELPAYGTENALGIALYGHENEDFYSDVALYLHDATHLRPFAVVVSNTSRTTAEQVIIRVRFNEPELDVLSPNERQPEPVKDRYAKMIPALFPNAGVSVIRSQDVSEVVLELGDIQPGTSAWSRQSFYLGCRTSKQFEAIISLSGHNIAEPIQLKQLFAFEVEVKAISADEVVELGDKCGG